MTKVFWMRPESTVCAGFSMVLKRPGLTAVRSTPAAFENPPQAICIGYKVMLLTVKYT
ncbi:MAG: hypothetical protein HC786_18475 [Richelia sp. CSU_2_1]|nr:hypothetical protein [Richelia sp. CSU_2_1]